MWCPFSVGNRLGVCEWCLGKVRDSCQCVAALFGCFSLGALHFGFAGSEEALSRNGSVVSLCEVVIDVGSEDAFRVSGLMIMLSPVDRSWVTFSPEVGVLSEWAVSGALFSGGAALRAFG